MQSFLVDGIEDVCAFVCVCKRVWLVPSMVALSLSVPIGIVVTRIGGKIKCPKQLL